ncbi:hypothetical protein NLJ89_g8464 [Agrocybe chaxingu]|uniref:VPS9 domain-containing protein n=1 Tax=Agrocybe chaxingu TaxID=84603 RepID=A0A9W8MUG9_9AGAR|nr:hypothetical protein NLJ89_g8464 [Agrocybe chaxingu]
MSLKRENDFPATSIGRSSGARLQQAAAAHEAHPLLSPTPSEQNLASGTTANGAPRYVPYTPRQRVTPTAATTGTTVHPPSPQQHQGDATSKLQLMHLKAAAQAIGLDSGTLGWAMLEKLVIDVESSDEWTEVWTVITSGKATLLLPLESASYEKITPDFMKDHIILCDSPSRKDTPIVTLSGLRGTLDDETLTFRSTINPTCKLFQDLLAPLTRTTALSHLPPLPTSTKYPKFHLPSYSSNLHVPPRAQPPNLLSHPAKQQTCPSDPNQQPLRVALRRQRTKPKPPLPGFAIDRRIVRKDLAKELNKALKAEIKASLSASSGPSWLAERVHDATAPWFPFIKTTAPSRRKAGLEKESNGNAYIVNPFEENPQDCSEHLQDIYLALEQDLRTSLPKKKDKEAESDVEDEKEREKRESERMETEIWVREVMEVVERTITSLFYDRLFMQSTTDDASHDEALSSRIAALNMLDLGLGHLGIDVGEVNESDLDAVVKACGDVLTKLEALRYPAEKAASLVEAHKIVVDGLSKLPPVRLISENDVNVDEDLPTAKPQSSTLDEGLSSVAYAEQPIATTALPASSLGLESSDPPLPSLPSDLPPTAHTSSGSDLKTSASSTKIKTVPPPLPLDTPSNSASPAASAQASSSPVQKSNDIQKEPTPVSGDVLLPMIIFSVVKANPPRLVSNLLFTQRFRNQSTWPV